MKALIDIDFRCQATTDSMTQIANKGVFLNQLSYLVADFQRNKREFSLTMMDIDHFKRYNDSYGHLEGDYALKKVANYFPENLRSTDMMARYGGEEFAILMPETSFEGAFTIYKRIAFDFKNIIFKPKKGIEETVTFSAGISTLHNDKLTQILEHCKGDMRLAQKEISKAMISAADWGLYQIKNSGRKDCYPGNCLMEYKLGNGN